MQALPLNDCNNISEYDIVVDVDWNGVGQEVSADYDSEEGRIMIVMETPFTTWILMILKQVIAIATTGFCYYVDNGSSAHSGYSAVLNLPFKLLISLQYTGLPVPITINSN